MSENTLEYYVAKGLFPEKKIGDTVTVDELKEWAKAAYGSCAIRTGGGFLTGGWYQAQSAFRYQIFPSIGITTYMTRTGYLFAIRYDGTGYNMGRYGGYCGYWGVSSQSIYHYDRAVDCDFLTYANAENWVAPDRAYNSSTAFVDFNGFPEVFGTGGLHVIDISLFTASIPGALTPELMLSIEESADNARYTPQMLLSIPYVATTSGWKCIDPRVDAKRMLDKFSATAYLEKTALQNGEYYVYVFFYNNSGNLANLPANTIDVYADGVQLDMYSLRATSYDRIAAGKIRISSSYMLSENDYVRVTISTRTNSNFLVTNSDSFSPWMDNTVSHTIGNSYSQAVAIFVAGKTSRFGNGDNVPNPSTSVWW